MILIKDLLNLKKSSIFIQTMKTILFLIIIIAFAVCLAIYFGAEQEKTQAKALVCGVLLAIAVGIWLSY